MQSPLFIGLSLFALGLSIVACSSRPRVDGHGDGEMTVMMPMRVVADEPGSEIIRGAKVTFFTREDCMILEEIAAQREAGRASSYHKPTGVSVFTSDDGTALVECRFRAAFLWSFEGGSRREVGNEIYPTGRFLVEKAGFTSRSIDARDLLPKVPYDPENFTRETEVRMQKEPNQALQTTSVTRSGFGKVPVSDHQRRGV